MNEPNGNAGAARSPDGYAHRYRDPFGGGTYLKFNGGGEVNGGRPIEAVPYWLGTQPVQTDHPDDRAVDRFAAAMKAKLAAARVKGRGGWEDKALVSAEALSEMLFAHIFKGDPRDVANFAMFLHERGEAITLGGSSRMDCAVAAFQLAEHQCAERHAAAGRLIEPGIAVEAGLEAAAPFLIDHDTAAALRAVADVLRRYQAPMGISKYDALKEIIGIVGEALPREPAAAPAA